MRTKEEILNGMSKIEFFFKCRTNFKFFCEKMLGVTTDGGMHEFQLRWFRLTQLYDRVVIEAPSGFSKTEIMGSMYPLWEMFRTKNRKILLISKTIKQSEGNLLSRMKGYITNNEFLKELFVPQDVHTSWNKTEIRTKNGHWVVNVPYNINIKGYRADITILDEADSYDETDTYFDHVVSRMNPHGKIIIISTPEGPTKLIGKLKEMKPKGYVFEKTVSLIDMGGRPIKGEHKADFDKGISIWPERFPTQMIVDKWEEMGRWKWMKNYMCEVIGESEDAIFPIQNILDAYDYSIGFTTEVDKEAQYFIGADFAISDGPKADFDAFVVVKKINEQYVICSMEIHKGWQRPAKVQRLKELWEHYQTDLGTIIVADESNMGTMVINDLRAAGVTVVPQNFHSAARKKLLVTLSNVLQGKALVIPRSAEDEEAQKYGELLKDQLTGFRRSRSEKTGSELIESHAAHDDVAISIAMAINEGAQHESMDLSPLYA